MEMKRNGDAIAAAPGTKTQRKNADQPPAPPLPPSFEFFSELAASYHASNNLQEALVKMSRDITQESKKVRALLRDPHRVQPLSAPLNSLFFQWPGRFPFTANNTVEPQPNRKRSRGSAVQSARPRPGAVRRHAITRRAAVQQEHRMEPSRVCGGMGLVALRDRLPCALVLRVSRLVERW